MAMRTTTERRLLDAAEELFFRDGIRATPVDAVLERAGVSPATLYRGYPSKEALLSAVLARRHGVWLDTWTAAIERQQSAEGRLLAVFDALDDFRARPGAARWCAVLGSAAEYAGADDGVAEAVRVDTDGLRTRLSALAVPVVGERASAALAEELLLVFSGALTMRLRDAPDPGGPARKVARTLIAARQEAPTLGPRPAGRP